MTQQPFRARGAVDLGALAARRAAEQAAATGPAPAAVLDVGEAGLQRDVLEASFALPVVVAFWSARAGGPGTEVLEAAVTARAGRLLLRRVDVDAEPRVAQAFGITAVEVPGVGALAPALRAAHEANTRGEPRLVVVRARLHPPRTTSPRWFED